MANSTKVNCENVFKHTEQAALTKAYTQKWIDIINEIEKYREKPDSGR